MGLLVLDILCLIMTLDSDLCPIFPQSFGSCLLFFGSTMEWPSAWVGWVEVKGVVWWWEGAWQRVGQKGMSWDGGVTKNESKASMRGYCFLFCYIHMYKLTKARYRLCKVPMRVFLCMYLIMALGILVTSPVSDRAGVFICVFVYVSLIGFKELPGCNATRKQALPAIIWCTISPCCLSEEVLLPKFGTIHV